MTSMTGMRGPSGANMQGNASGKIRPPSSRNDIVAKGYRKTQLSQMIPEQEQLLSQRFQDVGPESQTARLARGDEGIFEEMEAPAWRLFNEAQGQTAHRFSGMGGAVSARRGSGFQNQINKMNSSFAQDLASRRQDLMRQAVMDLHGMSQDLLNQRPYEKAIVEKPQKKMPYWQQLGLAAMNAAGESMKGNKAAAPIPGG